MSLRDLVEFWKIIEVNEEIRIQLQSVDAEQFPATAVKLGLENGFEFTEEEVKEISAEDYDSDDEWVTDEELEHLGAGPHPCTPSGHGALALMRLNMNLRNSGKGKK